MWAALIVIVDPGGDLRAGVVEAEERALVEKFVAHPLKLSQNPFCIGFSGAMKCQSI